MTTDLTPPPETTELVADDGGHVVSSPGLEVPDYSDKPAPRPKAKKAEKNSQDPATPAVPLGPGATGLSYRQLARLISAAIETTDPELKQYAKIVLERELGPLK